MSALRRGHRTAVEGNTLDLNSEDRRKHEANFTEFLGKLQ